MTRHVIRLPKQQDESVFKVELIVGKMVKTAASNSYFFAGTLEGQVIDSYKFFSGEGLDAYNLIASVGTLVLAIGVVLTLANAIASRVNGLEAGHDPWGGDTLEWFTLSPPDPHNFDVLPDVRSARPMRDIRLAIAHRSARGEDAARASQPVA